MIRESRLGLAGGLRGCGMLVALAVLGCRATAIPPGAPGGPRMETPEAVAIDAEIRGFLEAHRLPGLSVAVRRRDDLVFARGYGWADVGRRVPVTPLTLFPIGSVEKQFTAATVMRQVERGRLRLDVPITRYLPRLDTAGHVVTIDQMLHQISGLQEESTLEARRLKGLAPAPGGGPWAPVAPEAVGAGFSTDEISMFFGQPLYFSPGDRFSYSQPNYDLLCFVLAAATGETYYEAIAETARAAGLQRFHAEWTPRPARGDPEVAHGYRADDSTGFAEEWEENLGSAWTTAPDLARWSPELASGRVVSPASYERMTTPARLSDGRSWPYGYGIGLLPLAGRPRHRHTGRILGFYAVVSYYPEAELSIAIFANLGGASSIAYDLEERLARKLLGLPPLAVRYLPLPAAERDRLVGTYDGGGFWFDVVPDGDGIAVVLRDPDIVKDGDLDYRTTLLYQGGDLFSAPDGAEWRQVRFATGPGPAREMRLGSFAQGVRRTASREP